MIVQTGILTECFENTNGVSTSVKTQYALLEQYFPTVYQVHIYTSDISEAEPNIVKLHGTRGALNRVTTLPYPAIRLRGGLQLVYRLLRDKPDLLLVQHPSLMLPIGALVGKLRHIPRVFTAHTEYEQYIHFYTLGRSEKFQRRAKKAFRWWLRKFLPLYGEIIFPSHYMQQSLCNWLQIPMRGVVIPTPVLPVPDLINPRILASKWDIASEDFVIVAAALRGSERTAFSKPGFFTSNPRNP